MRNAFFVRSGCLIIAVVLIVGRSPAAERPVDFNRDVRPILSENCYFCHGPDPSNRQADLRLDVREEAIDFGAIVPGDVEASELVARIDSDDVDLLMPPPDSHKTLTDKQKDLLRRWIEQDAVYQPHWSFTPRGPVQVPEAPPAWTDSAADGLPASPARWIANPIDAFVLQHLAREGVNPSPPADADRLRRRLHLDLAGLPPVPQNGLATEDLTYDETVDTLLKSIRHAEAFASDWLDLVRYADTVGYHGDQTQNIFPYRDWVVEAIHTNMPFDQFTIRQLAGDLLPDATTDDLVASGFNRLNMMTREGGAQPGEYLAKYAGDRVRTVGMAWMGLTTGCAECHDHKFDPFTSKDFYSLAAYFDDVKQWGVYSDYGYTPNPELKGGNNDYPFYPEIEVPSDALLRRQHRLHRRIVELATSVIADDGERHAKWTSGRRWLAEHPTGWRIVTPNESELPGEATETLSDDSIRLSRDEQTVASEKPKKDKAGPRRFRFRADSVSHPVARFQSARIELLPGAEGNVLRDDAATATLTIKFNVSDADGKKTALKVRRSDANRRHPDYSDTTEILDVTGRWKLPRQKPDGTVHRIVRLDADPDRPLTAIFQFDRAVSIAPDETLEIEIDGGVPARLSFAFSPLVGLRPFDDSQRERWAVSTSPSDPTVAVSLALAIPDRPGTAELRRLETEYRRCRDGKAVTMVTQAMPPKTTRILPRGDWQNESGEIVMPSPPEFLGSFDQDSDSERRQTRSDLARWIVHPDNSLTARVVVNRWWKHFFGTGLTASADDVGAQGEPPTHPELLDWLAGELIRSGWDRRHLLRLIVTSNTYRQDSKVRESLRDTDPDNRWLAYHPPRRLPAGAVRDNALAIAGLLNLTVGGPPVKPYQPPGYYGNLQFPNRIYEASSGDDQYRRGLYMHWQRTFLHPMLANFDAPSREDCVAIRSTANTPQQALTLLNDPTFVEAARGLAILVLQDDDGDEGRLTRMIRRTLSREARRDEIDDLQSFLNERRQYFADATIEAEDLMRVGQPVGLDEFEALPLSSTATVVDRNAEVAAWTATARVLLNLHETITRY